MFCEKDNFLSIIKLMNILSSYAKRVKQWTEVFETQNDVIKHNPFVTRVSLHITGYGGFSEYSLLINSGLSAFE